MSETTTVPATPTEIEIQYEARSADPHWASIWAVTKLFDDLHRMTNHWQIGDGFRVALDHDGTRWTATIDAKVIRTQEAAK